MKQFCLSEKRSSESESCAVLVLVIFSLLLLAVASYSKSQYVESVLSLGFVGLAVDLCLILAISAAHRFAATRILVSVVFLFFLLTHVSGLWEKLSCGCFGSQKWSQLQMVFLTGFMSGSWAVAALSAERRLGVALRFVVAVLVCSNIIGIGFVLTLRTPKVKVAAGDVSVLTWQQATKSPVDFVRQTKCAEFEGSSLFFVVNPLCYDCRVAASQAEELAIDLGRKLVLIVPHGYPYTPNNQHSGINVCELGVSKRLLGFPTALFEVGIDKVTVLRTWVSSAKEFRVTEAKPL